MGYETADTTDTIFVEYADIDCLDVVNIERGSGRLWAEARKDFEALMLIDGRESRYILTNLADDADDFDGLMDVSDVEDLA